MTECTQTALQFPGFSRRKIDVSFNRGDITSNGGVQLLRLADERTGLIKAAARAIGDSRRTKSCTHALESLVRQRVYGISLGYEDLNDHEALRADLALQTALSRDESLASPSTLCRLENRANRNTAVALHKVLIDNFIASYKQAPRRLILDVDATDDRVHGGQEGRFFHGYYDHYCFLPLYVFCGDQLLVSYLRSSKIDGAKHSWAILALLIKRLRQAWPKVEILVRADSGFCRWRMLRWFDRHGVDYVIGIAKNPRLHDQSLALRTLAQWRYWMMGEKQRLFSEVRYAAQAWDTPRRVIVKAEHSARGSNPRFVVPHRQCPTHLRPHLLRPRRDGEPDQGAAVGPVCRSHQLPHLVGQSVPAVALKLGLHAVGDAPPGGTTRNGTGSRAMRHAAPETITHRRHRLAQYQAHPTVALQCLPQSRTVLPGGRSPQAGIVVPTPVASCSIPCESGCRSPPKRLVHRNRR